MKHVFDEPMTSQLRYKCQTYSEMENAPLVALKTTKSTFPGTECRVYWRQSKYIFYSKRYDEKPREIYVRFIGERRVKIPKTNYKELKARMFHTNIKIIAEVMRQKRKSRWKHAVTTLS